VLEPTAQPLPRPRALRMEMAPEDQRQTEAAELGTPAVAPPVATVTPIGFKVEFDEATADQEDEEVDFIVVIAPNTTKVKGKKALAKDAVTEGTGGPYSEIRGHGFDAHEIVPHKWLKAHGYVRSGLVRRTGPRRDPRAERGSAGGPWLRPRNDPSPLRRRPAVRRRPSRPGPNAPDGS
jgi:hypothetical protein